MCDSGAAEVNLRNHPSIVLMRMVPMIPHHELRVLSLGDHVPNTVRRIERLFIKTVEHIEVTLQTQENVAKCGEVFQNTLRPSAPALFYTTKNVLFDHACCISGG